VPGYRGPAFPARRWLAAGAATLMIAATFALNLRLSQTMGSNSDSAGPALEGWDMLHGNILQHGWVTADVPYFPTEVTEYALVVAVRGLNSDAVHWGGALTYTLAMALAALLAMGKAGAAPGRERLARGAIAAGIMIAPQLGAGSYTLLLGPDHFGTSVPLLAAWLVLDRSRPRWHVPVVVALIVGWTGVADLTALFIGALPLVAAHACRVARGVARSGLPLSAGQRYEAGLAGAGAVAAVMAITGPRILAVMGSVTHQPPVTAFAAADVVFWHNFRVMGLSLLILAGADFVGVHQPAQAALAILHLAGAVLGATGIAVAAWRFGRDKDAISQLLFAGIALNLLAFVAGTHSQEITFAREVSPVLPFGAVLAGRLLAGRLLAMRLAPALIVALCGYLAGLGYEVHQPVAPAQNAALVPVLDSLRLQSGLSGYWASNVITLDTGDRLCVRSLNRADGKVIPTAKLDEPAWYDPRHQYANFVVLYHGVTGTPPFTGFTGVPAFYYPKEVLATFGKPARTYHDGAYTILVWNKNLLADMTFPGAGG
jgi:hypothetical protein